MTPAIIEEPGTRGRVETQSNRGGRYRSGTGKLEDRGSEISTRRLKRMQ